jgi:DNA repair protein RecN (Recombination protein N)
MLTSLSIKHYALIDELSVDLPGGLVILTGETGAGKSILVDAMGLILGERASPEVVRSGADKTIVEATLDITGNDHASRLLKESQLDLSSQVILRREVVPNGQSRCFVNDTPVSLSFLRRMGDVLVDLHGQHEHQSLLRPQTHGEMLDAFAGVDSLLADYRVAFRTLGESMRELEEVRKLRSSLAEARDLHTFQLQEIDAVDPQEGEEEHLLKEAKVLEHAEQIFAMLHQLLDILHAGERSAAGLLSDSAERLDRLAEIDDRLREPAAESHSAKVIVDELVRFLQAYLRGIEFSAERLEQVRDRLGRLSNLKRKYGGSIERVREHREGVSRLLAQTDNVEERQGNLEASIKEAKSECAKLAEELSSKRIAAARIVEAEVVRELAHLGITHATFRARVDRRTSKESSEGIEGYNVSVGGSFHLLGETGFDEVEFQISTNVGEEVRPLARIASGGEISRIMLALKSILAKRDRLPVVVFDEIDVGVSGRIARAVGKSLRKLSKYHQVIAITHLPQIASLADAHFLVHKTEDASRARTSIRQLEGEERVHEVARLLSGSKVTKTAMSGARELIGLMSNVDKG